MEPATEKEISSARAQDMIFVKPTHSDIKPDDKIQCIKRSEFDPRHPVHRMLQQDSLTKLLNHIQKSLPTSGLQQFWLKSSQDGSHDTGEHSKLWGNVIFWHETATTISQDKFYVPTTAQCIDYMNTMKLSLTEVNDIEFATRGQTDNQLWLALHNGQIISSRFEEILHRRQSTNPRRLVKDIMGYGEKMKCLPPQMRWGKDSEPTAIKCYLESRQKNGEAISFEPTGLHLLPEKCYLGASSDGKLLCTSVDTCFYGCWKLNAPTV